jgi:hypothetical protein
MRRFLFLFALVPSLAFADECRFTAQRDFDVDAAGLKTLAIALESHDVVVEGVSGLTKIEVRGRACASDEAWLASLTVEQQRNGDALALVLQQKRSPGWSWFNASYAYLELHVRVPAPLELGIRGTSGDARVRGVAALDFDTRSGDLEANAIAGALTLEVSSGDVSGADIGRVDVRSTSSGDIKLRDVRGDVKVTRSGSGDLRFDNVGGNVEIGDVGSGDVSISGVERNVAVDSIGSGDLRASDIGGDFSVRASGSGDVHHRGVRGSVSVPRDED